MEKIYAFTERFADEYFNVRAMVTPEDKKQAFMFFGSGDYKKQSVYSIDGETAVIKIEGPLSKSGPDEIDMWLGYGGTSYADIISAAEEIGKTESVKTVYLEYDTPGGEANPAHETASALYELSRQKNTIAVNKGSMASAGMWLGSQSKKIYATSPLSEFGSVGVVWVLYDRERDAKSQDGGAARVRIVSQNAKNKRPDITKPAERKWMQDLIDGIERIMIADIAKGRNTTSENIIENYGQGAMFLTKDPDPDVLDAIKIGMADGLITYNSEFKESELYESAQNPAENSAGKNNPTEVKPMALAELLSQNPAAKAEYDRALTEHGQAQFEAGKISMQERMTAAGKYLGPESAYPGTIKAIAVDVLNCKKSVEALETTVSAFDAFKESQKSTAAIDETEAHGETPGEQGPKASTDGILKTEADILAETAKYKGGK